MAQNSLAGNPDDGFRNPDLECAVIDKTGVAYYGILKSSIVDIDYDMTENELKEIKKPAGGTIVRNVIRPVSNKNRAEWKTKD